MTRHEQAGLLARLQPGPKVTVRAAVAGTGGMGKSTLAIAVAHALAPRMHGIWWIQAATADSLRSSLAVLGRTVNAPSADSTNPSEAAAATLLYLRSRRDPWLLIYDNADDPVMVGPWLPPEVPHIRTLITSRTTTWPAEQMLELGRMQPDESLAMLRAGLPARGAEDLAALADRLGHWPLALTAAIGFLSLHQGTTVAGYLAKFDITRAELLRLNWTGVSYADPDRAETLSVAAAMRLTTDRLAPDDRDLLSVLALLNPDDLWPEMVANGAADEVRAPFDDSAFPEFLTRAGQDAALVTQGMDRLRAVSLVFERDSRAQMHRLFAELWRAGLDDPALWSNAAARVVNSSVPHDNDSEGNWETCARLTGHARALLANGADSLAAARLFAQIAGFLYHRGPQPGDIALAQGSVAINARLAPGSASHASSLNNIAGVHFAMRDHAAAEPLLLEALRIDTAALGDTHPGTITAHRNLGALYGDWAQTAPPAQAGVQRAKEAQAKATALDLSLGVNGPRHQDTAVDRNNAAIRLAQAGDIPAALDQMRIAAAIRLDMLPTHARTMQSMQAYVAFARHTGQPAATLLPALLAEVQAQRAAHIAWGRATLADLLRDHGIAGDPSVAILAALAQAIAARQTQMRAQGKPFEVWNWPGQHFKNARDAATLPPDLPPHVEPAATRMLAALVSAPGLPDNGGERTAP